MHVTITKKGSSGGNNGGNSGTTTEVEAPNEVKGTVTAIDAATTSSSIGTTKVVTDATTVFENLTPATFASITVDLVVEVHGTPNSAGDVVATLVEAKKAAGGTTLVAIEIEIRKKLSASAPHHRGSSRGACAVLHRTRPARFLDCETSSASIRGAY